MTEQSKQEWQHTHECKHCKVDFQSELTKAREAGKEDFVKSKSVIASVAEDVIRIKQESRTATLKECIERLEGRKHHHEGNRCRECDLYWTECRVNQALSDSQEQLKKLL